jgi:ribonucleotide reductase beta subunit family protein with ferritin-like domain
MKTVLNTANIDTTKQPMFLGEDLALQRYDRFKYPKFFDLWRKQEEFHWLPEEISLTKDRSDYENLSDTERFIFNSNLMWQTMTDSMLSRSIHNIKNYVSNPELEICMTTWARFETIHSYSYTYILQNITKDATRFFDSILENVEIVKRANEISAAYNKLLCDDTKDIKQKIFNAIISTQITEGLAFYVSFACSFFFGYKGKMEGNSKIVGLIARDENLHAAVTQNILKYWKENKDEGFQEIVENNKQRVYDMYGLAVENEKKWAEYLFSQGSLLGLNSQMLCGYVEWLANTRLRSLGYDKIFDQPTNPIGGWLNSFNDSSKVQVAPQETEISSYKIGARDTKINEEEFENFDL